MILIIPIQKKMDALLNFPSSNCNFIHVAKICYYHINYTQEDGSLAHGLHDVDSIGRKTLH